VFVLLHIVDVLVGAVLLLYARPFERRLLPAGCPPSVRTLARCLVLLLGCTLALVGVTGVDSLTALAQL
jgi:hypothetical protein